jgi:hypothetical protein
MSGSNHGPEISLKKIPIYLFFYALYLKSFSLFLKRLQLKKGDD